MDLPFEKLALDASKCRTMDERREIVYQLSGWVGACDLLQSWSRQDILKVLCAEMGKERKYTGLTKLKIIEHLLKIVSEKKSEESEPMTDMEVGLAPVSSQRANKRLRKIENPSRLPFPVSQLPTNNAASDSGNTSYCKNTACKATLRQDDSFCKRCSCCICYKYDDNKDPSLWLTCSSEPPYEGLACGMSCHLECALRHESSGIGENGHYGKLDGIFCCVACGKVNDLLGCWRKQIMMAKDTRRVDILCYRISLSQKLLNGMQRYEKLSMMVDEAVQKLEAEVGPVTGLPVKMGRGIVNRLSSGPDVQKVCALALESLDEILGKTTSHPQPRPAVEDSKSIVPTMVRFENVRATSLVVVIGSEIAPRDGVSVYALWHRKAYERTYPAEPTCRLLVPNTRFTITGLSPATEYQFKIVSFDGTRESGSCEVHFSTDSQYEVPNCGGVAERSQSPTTNCSSLSNPSSVEDETNISTPCGDQIVNREDKYSTYCKESDKICSVNMANNAATPGTGGPTHAVPVLGREHTSRAVGSQPDSDLQKPENEQFTEGPSVGEMSTDSGSDAPGQTGMECVPFVGNLETTLPITPCKLEILKDLPGRNSRSKSGNKDLPNGAGKGEGPQDGSTSKKRRGGRQDEDCTENGLSDKGFEYYVKVIRWLECEGHVAKNFRQKFLTWYSLRATTQEMRVVKAFVDTFIEDPASLAEQLIDTFSECISNKKSTFVPAGFCTKLWH